MSAPSAEADTAYKKDLLSSLSLKSIACRTHPDNDPAGAEAGWRTRTPHKPGMFPLHDFKHPPDPALSSTVPRTSLTPDTAQQPKPWAEPNLGGARRDRTDDLKLAKLA